MDKAEAIRLCREYLSKCIEFKECNNLPSGVYNLDPSDKYLFSVRFSEGSSYVGSTAYIAVSKKTGVVRFLGYLGE